MTDNVHVSLQDCLLQRVLFATGLQLPRLWVGSRVHDKDLLLLVTDRADVSEVPELDCSCSAWTSSPMPLLPAALSQRCACAGALRQGSDPQCSLKAHLFSLLSLSILHRHFSQKICITGFQPATCFSDAHTPSRRKQGASSQGWEASIWTVFIPRPLSLHFPSTLSQTLM